jgi:DNA-binding beta-propeller fold protein YncE
MFKRAIIAAGVSLCLAFLFASCATPPEKIEEREYVWPLPPEKPRVRYIKSLWGEEDVMKSAPSDFIVGKDPSTDLFKPYGLATDHSGRLYVTDTVRRVVFVFDELMGDLRFLGLREMPLGVPADVVVDQRERVYISDAGRDRIVVFDQDDRILNQFGQGILDNPAGMAVDEGRQRLYVVSTHTHTVEVFSLDGKHLFRFGGHGNSPGKFNYPMDIAIGPTGDLYVVDSANFRVQVFTSEGDFVREFGSLGTGPGQFSRPKGIAVDMAGRIFVTDASFNNFQIFNDMGRLLLFVGTGGVTGPGEFSLPADIEVDDQGRIYVADQLNKRVQVFEMIRD